MQTRLQSSPSHSSITDRACCRARPNRKSTWRIRAETDSSLARKSLGIFSFDREHLKLAPWAISFAATFSMSFASSIAAVPNLSSELSVEQQREVCMNAGIEQATGRLNVTQNTFYRAHRFILICQAPGDQLNEDQTFGVRGNQENEVRGTGNRIWESSLVLTRFMEAGLPSDFWAGKRVVELGGGQGLVSITAAALGADEVYLTDGDESALKLASSNVSLNEQLWAGSTEGQPVHIGNDPDYVLQDMEFADIGRRLHPMLLRWGLPLPASSGLASPDIVLASDTLYNLRSLGPFMASLNNISGPETQIFVANAHRVPAEQDLQLQLLAKAFDMKEVPLQPDLLDGLQQGKVSIYELKKRGEASSEDQIDNIISDLAAMDKACQDPLECIYATLDLKAKYHDERGGGLQ